MSTDPIAPEERIASPPRRYTLDGDDTVEARIDRDQRVIAEAVAAAVDPRQFAALVLIGGYGRGEGGYVQADGAEPAPFDDYNYVLVLRQSGRRARAALTRHLGEVAESLRNKVGVDVRIGLLRAEQLRQAELSLMNAEMRWGHRVVAGDQDLLLAMRPMPFHRLPAGEITRLMLNRGALLLMNQQRLQPGGLEPSAREVHFKQLLKAVLACGDARLAAVGRYHPSYPVKLERLEASSGPAAELLLGAGERDKFLTLYRVAYRHRFHPSYGEFDQESPLDWQARAVRLWLSTLRNFEIHRLGSSFDGWSDYCRPAIGKGQTGNPLLRLSSGARAFGVIEALRRPGRAWRHPRERLISALPLLLSESGSILDPCAASALALAPQTLWKDAADEFLRLWRRLA